MASAIFHPQTKRAAGLNCDALFISSALTTEINDDAFLQQKL